MLIFSETVKVNTFRSQVEVECLQPPVEVVMESVNQLVFELLEAGQNQVMHHLVGLNEAVPLPHKVDLRLHAFIEILHVRGYLHEDAVGDHAASHARRHLVSSSNSPVKSAGTVTQVFRYHDKDHDALEVDAREPQPFS